MQTVPRLYTHFRPDHYQLELSLNRPDRHFSGIVHITGTWIDDSHIALHAKDIVISSATIDDHPVHYEHTDDILSIFPESAASKGALTITIAYSGTIIDGMHGLYPCYYETDGVKKELLATQFESHHAREVLPCIDEPEAKATFCLTLLTEVDVTVLGNMPVHEQRTDNNQLITTFETTPRMSPYLLAFVVGELQKKSGRTNNGTEVNIFATHAQPAESLDFALSTAIKSIEYFNDYFDTPYPLPKCDHVALPDFTSGAMENWGLITYREIGLLATNSTAVSLKEYIATVIVHETSHQWFGNLVTMQWWDDLWLNESFATLMQYLAIDSIYPEWDIWTTFTNDEAVSALRRDCLPGVQAVRTGVNHPDEISSIFDPSIVYAKGARLLNMLLRYIGEQAFREGLTEYFKTFAYKNTTGDDLWRVLSDASGKDIKTFMHRWIEQPGMPIVMTHISKNTLRLSQERFLMGESDEKTDVTWPIPLAASNSSLPEMLDASSVTLPLPQGSLLYLNKGNAGHFLTHYDPSLYSTLQQAVVDGKIDSVDRLALLNETSLLARAGLQSATDLSELLLAYENETDEPIWSIIGLVISDLKRFVESDDQLETKFKSHVAKLALPLHQQLGWDQAKEEPETSTKLRASILGLLTYCDYPPVLDEGLARFHKTDDLEMIDGEIRSIILLIAAKHGSDQDRDRLFDLYPITSSSELQNDICAGLTATKDVNAIKRQLEILTNSEIVRPQDVGHWFAYLIRNRYAREMAWEWMVGHWQWIFNTFSGDKSYDYFPRYAASGLSTYQWKDKFDAFFNPMRDQPALTRSIDLASRDIASRAAWLDRDFKGLRATLLDS